MKQWRKNVSSPTEKQALVDILVQPDEKQLNKFTLKERKEILLIDQKGREK